MENIEVCNRCPNTLERGRVEHFKGEDLLETICHICDANDHLQEYQKTRRLNSTLILNAITGRVYRDEVNLRINTEREMIEESVKDFEKEVWWDGGLQAWNKKSRTRGFSVTQGNIEARMYTIAGRTMITMLDQAKDIDVTVITSEDDERKFHREYGMSEFYMGLQSVNATAQEAIELVADVRRLHSQGQLNFQPNDQISVI